MTQTNLELALMYAEMGFPVLRLVPGNKNPMDKGGVYSATKNIDEIKSRWAQAPSAGVGIPMGMVSGLIGIDVDYKDGCRKDFTESLLPSETVLSPNGGRHVYYKNPERGIKNGLKLETGATVRSDGYFFAVPPTIINQGTGVYRWETKGIHLVSPAECPEWIIQKNDEELRKSKTYTLPDVIKTGDRHANFLRLGGSMRAKGATEEEILAAFIAINSRASEPMPVERMRLLAKDIFNRYQPNKISVPQVWRTVGQDMLDEREERIADYQTNIPFGISFLDLATGGGLVKKDLALVLAKTGAGKTEFVSTVAANAINAGKSIAMFALEAEEKEISRRIKFKHLAPHYFDKKYFPTNTYKKINFVDWEAGKFDDLLLEKEKEITKQLSDQFSKMFVMYKTEEFGMDDLKQAMIDINPNVDLFILDHAGMVDHDSENENRAMTDLVSTIRQMALVVKKPVVVVSHVRKSDPRFQKLIPSLEDVHGTSNLVKVCTKVIVLGPATDQEAVSTQFPTYMRLAKFRKDGSRTRYAAIVNFDVSTNSYSNSFAIGELKKGDTEFERILDPNKMPYWARQVEQ